MRRRELICLLAGAPVAWPFAASGQQPERIWQIGVLVPPNFIEAVRQGLRDLGYVEGRNIVIENWPFDSSDQLPAFAAELVALKVDVIVVGGSQAVRAAQQETRSIPIVIVASSDPVRTGFVASLAHSGGNTTGLSIVSPELSGKRLELLREIVPGLSRIVILSNPDDPSAKVTLPETETAANAFGMQVQSLETRTASDFDTAFASMTQTPPDAVVILPAPITSDHADRIAAFALKAKLPTISFDEHFPKAGGLISYGTSLNKSIRRSAVFVDKILKGANPGDLPIEQPTKFDLVVNLATAKTLGLTVPPSIFLRADEVIE
jgi:putative ABC transport system substrate-binding protein